MYQGWKYKVRTLTNGLTTLEYTQLTTALLVEARRTPYSLVDAAVFTRVLGIEYAATHPATPSSSSNQGAKCPTHSDNLLTLAMQPANTPCKAPRAQLHWIQVHHQLHHAAGASPRDESGDGWAGEADLGGISGASASQGS